MTKTSWSMTSGNQCH